MKGIPENGSGEINCIEKKKKNFTETFLSKSNKDKEETYVFDIKILIS